MVLRPRGAPLRLTKSVPRMLPSAHGTASALRLSSISGLTSPARTCRSPTLRLPPHSDRRMVHGESGWLTSLSAGTFTRQHSTSWPGAPRVAASSILPTCQCQYPGGNGAVHPSLASRIAIGLPLINGGSAPALPVSRPARHSRVFRPAGLLSRPRRPFDTKVLQSTSLPLQTALAATNRSDNCCVGFAPTRKTRLSTAHVESGGGAVSESPEGGTHRPACKLDRIPGSVTPVRFHTPAHRTQRAIFQHWALQWDHAPRTQKTGAVTTTSRSSGSPMTCAEDARLPPLATLPSRPATKPAYASMAPLRSTRAALHLCM